jgi:hypothetical protein
MEIPRITGPAAKYSTAYLIIGIFMMVIGAVRAGGYDYQDERVGSGHAVRGNVVAVQSEDCVATYGRRRAHGQIHTPCYRLKVNLFAEPNNPRMVEVVAEKDGVGELKVDDKVFVVFASDGSGKYFVLNARDTEKFFTRKYIHAGVALVGVALVLISLLCKTGPRSSPLNVR